MFINILLNCETFVTNIKYNLFAGLFIAFIFFSGIKIYAQNNYGYQKVGPQNDGTILVPTNQLLKPAGFQVYMPGRPVDLSLILNEKLLIVKNKSSLDLIRLSDRTILQSLRFPESGSSFTGIYYSDNNRSIYLTGAKNKIHIADLNENNILSWKSPILLPNPSIGGSPVPGGIVLNDNEDKIFVTLSRNNSLAVINMYDTSISEIKVGIAPYDILLKSNSKAYVSNWGGRQPKPGESSYNSSGSQVSY